jgi:hypothetical protein
MSIIFANNFFTASLFQRGKEGDLPKWRPTNAVQAWHENDLKHFEAKEKRICASRAKFQV